MEVLEENNHDEQMRWLKMSEIEREKLELFHDFVTNLLKNIDETYLGSEYLPEEMDLRRHFKWCWDKTVDQFEKERIFFHKSDTVNMYFYVLVTNTFYKIRPELKPMDNLKGHMDILFTSTNKTNLEFDIFYDTYTELKDCLKIYGRIK